MVRLSGSSKKLKCSHPSVSTQRCWHSWKSAAFVSNFEISENVVSLEIFVTELKINKRSLGFVLCYYPFPSLQKNYLSHVYIGPLWLIIDVNLMFKSLFWLLNKLGNTQNSGYPWDGCIKYPILFFGSWKIIVGPGNTRNSEFPWDLVRRTPLRRLLLHCSHPEWHILRKITNLLHLGFV